MHRCGRPEKKKQQYSRHISASMSQQHISLNPSFLEDGNSGRTAGIRSVRQLKVVCHGSMIHRRTVLSYARGAEQGYVMKCRGRNESDDLGVYRLETFTYESTCSLYSARDIDDLFCFF